MFIRKTHRKIRLQSSTNSTTSLFLLIYQISLNFDKQFFERTSKDESFSMKTSLSNVNKLVFSGNLATFTKEVFNGKLCFICCVRCETHTGFNEEVASRR